MQFRSNSWLESPSHQLLYKRDPSNSITRRRNSITPSRGTVNNNGLALAVIPPGSSAGRGSVAGAASGGDSVYVADINPVYSVTATVRCFVPVNDRVMWSAEYNGSLCVRALPKGTSLRTLPGREGTYCISLLYVREADLVWAGFQDGYLHLYEARTMDLVKEVMAHSGGLNCITQIDDSVFTGGADWKVCQWSFDDGTAQLQRTLHNHRGGVRSLSVYDGPTGAVLFTGSDDGTIRAWDPYMSAAGVGSESPNIHTFLGHERAVLSLVVVPHVNQLWSGGEDMTLRVWNMQTLECLNVLRGGHTAPIANLMVVESRVWSADKHGHILVWDITTHSLLQDLADRVPYWGIGQGMILAMGKVQPTTAYKIWTASSNGVMQCWNAETIPIVFDELPIAAGVLRPTVAQAINTAGAAGTVDGSCRRSGGSAVSTPCRRGAGGVDASALTVSTSSAHNNGLSNGSNSRGESAPAQAAAMSRLQAYVQRLEHDLQCVQRDAKSNYEKYRLEVQLEIETQQLLAQENVRLRDRVRELEDMAGVPHEESGAVAASSVRSARGNGVPQKSTSVADTDAWTAEIEDLRKQLAAAHKQLGEAFRRQQEHRQQPMSAVLHGLHSLEKSPEITTDNFTADPARQFVRQDDFAKLPSMTGAALSDSAALGHHTAAHTASRQSSILSASHDEQWDEKATTRTCLSRHFNGEHWEYLMNEKPYELHSTLTADLCAGLGVAPTQLKSVDLHGDGLTFDVDVVHPATVPSAELERRMREYRFPGITTMHAQAFTTAKTTPDTAEATIVDLQEQLANLERALAEAQEEQREQARVVEPSPEPQQPYSHLRPYNNYAEDGHANAAKVAAAEEEQKRLRTANVKLQKELQDQLRDMERLKSAMENREYQLATLKEDLKRRDDELRLALKQQVQLTPNAYRLRDSYGSPDLHRHRLDDSAAPAPPEVDGTARKKAGSEPTRPTELVAVPLAGEMSAAAAGTGAPHDQAQRTVGVATQDDPNTQRFIAQLQQSLKEARETIAALEAEKKQPAPSESRGSDARLSPQTESLRELAPKLAQAEKQNDELQRANESLKRDIADLKKHMTKLEQELRAEKQKLAVAAAATPSALARSPETIHASTSTENNDTASNNISSKELQQLLDDHEALNHYLHDQLKPLISRLKRAGGESQLDRDRLLERLAAMERAAAAVGANDEVGNGKSHSAAGNRKEPAAPTTAAQEALRKAEPSSESAHDDTANTQQLREDYEALNHYLHDQLKPMISHLKRARGELQLDLSRAQENLQQACDMYEEAAAALEEARVREEKTGETIEALRKALEAEQQRNQASAKPPAAADRATAAEPGQHPADGPLQSEETMGRPTEPVQLDGGTSSGALGGKERAEDVSDSLPSQTQQEESNLHDAIDRLAAQNLDLSVRLADAETVISQLQDSVGLSAEQLEQQRREAQRLLDKIERFQQGGCSRSDNVPTASTSVSFT